MTEVGPRTSGFRPRTSASRSPSWVRGLRSDAWLFTSPAFRPDRRARLRGAYGAGDSGLPPVAQALVGAPVEGSLSLASVPLRQRSSPDAGWRICRSLPPAALPPICSPILSPRGDYSSQHSSQRLPLLTGPRTGPSKMTERPVGLINDFLVARHDLPEDVTQQKSAHPLHSVVIMPRTRVAMQSAF